MVSRSVKLAKDFNEELREDDELIKRLDLEKIKNLMDEFKLHEALDEIFHFIHETNQYINDKKPWKQEGEELGKTLFNVLNACKYIAVLISPFMPDTAKKIAEQLGIEIKSLEDCYVKTKFFNVKIGPHLFEPIKFNQSA